MKKDETQNLLNENFNNIFTQVILTYMFRNFPGLECCIQIMEIKNSVKHTFSETDRIRFDLSTCTRTRHNNITLGRHMPAMYLFQSLFLSPKKGIPLPSLPSKHTKNKVRLLHSSTVYESISLGFVKALIWHRQGSILVKTL